MGKFLKIAACALLITGTAAFAQNVKKFEVGVSVSPYSFQSVNYKSSEFKSVNSKYGTGVKIDGKYFFTDELYAGLDAAFDSYYLGPDYTTWYSNLRVMPVVGYRYNFSPELYIYTEGGVGLVLGMYSNTAKPYFGTKVEVGFGYWLTENFAVKSAVETDWHLQHHATSSKTANVIALNTYICAAYRF